MNYQHIHFAPLIISNGNFVVSSVLTTLAICVATTFFPQLMPLWAGIK